MNDDLPKYKQIGIKYVEFAKKEGIEFIDIMPLIIQKETFSEIIEKFAQEYISKLND